MQPRPSHPNRARRLLTRRVGDRLVHPCPQLRGQAPWHAASPAWQGEGPCELRPAPLLASEPDLEVSSQLGAGRDEGGQEAQRVPQHHLAARVVACPQGAAHHAQRHAGHRLHAGTPGFRVWFKSPGLSTASGYICARSRTRASDPGAVCPSLGPARRCPWGLVLDCDSMACCMGMMLGGEGAPGRLLSTLSSSAHAALAVLARAFGTLAVQTSFQLVQFTCWLASDAAAPCTHTGVHGGCQ